MCDDAVRHFRQVPYFPRSEEDVPTAGQSLFFLGAAASASAPFSNTGAATGAILTCLGFLASWLPRLFPLAIKRSFAYPATERGRENAALAECEAA